MPSPLLFSSSKYLPCESSVLSHLSCVLSPLSISLWISAQRATEWPTGCDGAACCVRHLRPRQPAPGHPLLRLPIPRAQPHADLSMVDSNPWRRQGSRPQDCRSRSKTCAWGALEAFHRRGGGTAGSRRSSTPPVAADTTRRSMLLMRFSGISGIPEPEISGTRIVGFLFSLK